jgi:hypothetical protein
MENDPSAGFPKYRYPEWSQIIGWFIFAACIVPIPLVYIINYIKEYLDIRLKTIVRLFFF